MSTDIYGALGSQLETLLANTQEIKLSAERVKANETKLNAMVNSAVSFVQQLKSKEGSTSAPELTEKIKGLLDQLSTDLNEIKTDLEQAPSTDNVTTTIKSLQDLLQPVQDASPEKAEETTTTSDEPESPAEEVESTVKKAEGFLDKTLSAAKNIVGMKGGIKRTMKGGYTYSGKASRTRRGSRYTGVRRSKTSRKGHKKSGRSRRSRKSRRSKRSRR